MPELPEWDGSCSARFYAQSLVLLAGLHGPRDATNLMDERLLRLAPLLGAVEDEYRRIKAAPKPVPAPAVPEKVAGIIPRERG
jgi:hypothetical protein